MQENKMSQEEKISKVIAMIAMKKKPEVVKNCVIAAKLTDINGLSSNGAMILHSLAKLGPAELIPWLIEEYGADVNKQHGDGKQTPLHFAAQAGNISAALALLAQGADSTIKNCFKNTS